MMKKTLTILAILILIFVQGCKGKNPFKTSGVDVSTESQQKPRDQNVDILEEQIYDMTLSEKIGQMVIVGLEGEEKDFNSIEMIERYKVGGFIFFDRNIKDSNQLLKLINELKETNEGNIPLFFSVDEEGGSVSRMPDEFSKFPTNKTIGEVNNREFSCEIGKTIGKELKAFGINMNFAPVLDINSNPQNPVIGDRSFGSYENIVSSLGVETMKGIQSEIISVVKHFPGHGDTSVDSHVGLPVVNYDIERLKNFELVPFTKAIEEGADIIMVAHILLPKIDEKNPATMSKSVITDLLRNEMEFDGVVITDDMTMGAITENYDIQDAAVKSVGAGADIILICHDNKKQVKVIEALKSAVVDGIIPEDMVNKKVYRILKLKQRYELNNQRIETVNVEGINRRIKDTLNRYLN